MEAERLGRVPSADSLMSCQLDQTDRKKWRGFFASLSPVEKEQQQERQLKEAMAAKRKEYMQLTAAYDQLLEEAHALEHGSPQIQQVLSKVNALGKEAAAALREYHDAVERLVGFYKASASDK